MLDNEQTRSLGVVAETHAQWLLDHPDPQNDQPDDTSIRIMATAYMRLFYECIERGIIRPGGTVQ